MKGHTESMRAARGAGEGLRRGIAAVFVVLIAYWGLMTLMRLVRHGVWDVADLLVVEGADGRVVRFFAGLVVNVVLAGVVVLYGRATGLSFRKLGGQYLKGAVISVGMIGAISALTYVGGGLRWVGTVSSSSFDAVEFVAVLFLAMTNVREEFLYRWWMMGELKRHVSTVWVVVVSSLLFGLAHAGNPNVTPLAIVNLALLGAFWALCYLRTGSMMFVAAMHSFWNFAQQRLLGLPMSGSSSRGGILNFEGVDSGLFATDAFGLEGNAATTIVLIISLLLMVVPKVATATPRCLRAHRV